MPDNCRCVKVDVPQPVTMHEHCDRIKELETEVESVKKGPPARIGGYLIKIRDDRIKELQSLADAVVLNVCKSVGYEYVMRLVARVWLTETGKSALTIGPAEIDLMDCSGNHIDGARCEWCCGTGGVTERVFEAMTRAKLMTPNQHEHRWDYIKELKAENASLKAEELRIRSLAKSYGDHEQRWRKLMLACNTVLVSPQAGPDLKIVVRKLMSAAGVEPSEDRAKPRPTCPDHPDSSPSSARSVGTGKRTWFCLVCARKLGPAPDSEPTWEGQDVTKDAPRSKP